MGVAWTLRGCYTWRQAADDESTAGGGRSDVDEAVKEATRVTEVIASLQEATRAMAPWAREALGSTLQEVEGALEKLRQEAVPTIAKVREGVEEDAAVEMERGRGQSRRFQGGGDGAGR